VVKVMAPASAMKNRPSSLVAQERLGPGLEAVDLLAGSG